ncbi:MAG: iron-containing alcohol dehydrogenase [Anaerolineaceae bacterium]|nr:iron-containing alcohol dehydrogenase [Anaerolineaceae bacterium]
MALETIYTMDTSSIKIGHGATREVGFDLVNLGVKRVMVVTDPNLVDSESVHLVCSSARVQGVDVELYHQVRVEPTDQSFKEAIALAAQGKFDGFVAVGGGSVMDTAKAANLYATYPADFLDYVNLPIGKGKPVPGRLKPLIAIPTTAGTGSETTGVAIFDLVEKHIKTGIAHRALRPTLGIIDANNTRTLPPMVAACSGLDILCHAVESLTALPYSQRPAPENPGLRPAYQGANPISDIWTTKAIEIVAKYLLRAMRDADDIEAREQLLLAASFAGIGFGNSGVHLPHGMSYPVAGMVRDYYPEGYVVDHPMIPHGMSVILNAPAVFRFTAQANPERHLYAAGLMGVDVKEAAEADAGHILANAIITIMKDTGMPNGLSAVGYDDRDVEALADGTLPQHRVTKLSPRPADKATLMQLFRDAMCYW